MQWAFQRETAATAVRYLAGVKGVGNLISLKPRVSASVVKTDIEAALKRRATRDAHNVSVSVNGAEVTLSGKVPTLAERQAVGNAAWCTPDVRSLVDNVTISY